MASNPMSKQNIGNPAIHEWRWVQIYCPILELKITLIKDTFNFKDNCVFGWCQSKVQSERHQEFNPIVSD